MSNPYQNELIDEDPPGQPPMLHGGIIFLFALIGATAGITLSVWLMSTVARLKFGEDPGVVQAIILLGPASCGVTFALWLARVIARRRRDRVDSSPDSEARTSGSTADS